MTDRMTAAEYRDQFGGANKMIKSKYRNVKTTVDGITFDSKREAARYCELKLMERSGEITFLELQPKFILQEGFTTDAGENIREIAYIADFSYHELSSNKAIVEDTKGVETKDFRIKRKLLLKRYPEYELRVIK